MSDPMMEKKAALAVHYNQGNYPAFLGEEDLSEQIHYRTLTHWHEEFEFLRIMSGRMIHEINGVQVELREGDILFINVRQMHRSKPVPENGRSVRCVFRILQVHPSALYGDLLLARSYILPLMNSRTFRYLHIPAEHPDIQVWHELFDLSFRCACAEGSGRDLALTGTLYVMLSLLKKEWAHLQAERGGQKDSSGLADVKRMLAFIYTHYQQKIGLEDIAGEAATSRSRCTRLFKKYMDLTPTEFLNRYRLQTASEKLMETDEPIAEIALSCGFSDQSYFGKVFRKAYRMSPGRYRMLKGVSQGKLSP